MEQSERSGNIRITDMKHNRGALDVSHGSPVLGGANLKNLTYTSIPRPSILKSENNLNVNSALKTGLHGGVRTQLFRKQSPPKKVAFETPEIVTQSAFHTSSRPTLTQSTMRNSTTVGTGIERTTTTLNGLNSRNSFKQRISMPRHSTPQNPAALDLNKSLDISINSPSIQRGSTTHIPLPGPIVTVPVTQSQPLVLLPPQPLIASPTPLRGLRVNSRSTSRRRRLLPRSRSTSVRRVNLPNPGLQKVITAAPVAPVQALVAPAPPAIAPIVHTTTVVENHNEELIQKMSEENLKSSKELSLYKQEMAVLEKENFRRDLENKNLANDRELLYQRLEESEAKNRQLQDQLGEYESKILSLSGTIDDLDEIIAKTTSEKIDLQNELSALRDRLDMFEREIDLQIHTKAQLNDSEQKIANLQIQVNNLTSELEALKIVDAANQGKLLDLNLELQNKQNLLNASKAQMEAMGRQLESAGQDHLDASTENANLRSTLRQFQRDSQDANKLRIEFENKREQLEHKCRRLEDENAGLKQDFNSLSAKYTLIVGQMDSKEGDFNNLKNQLEEAGSQFNLSLKRLGDQNLTLEAENRRLKGMLESTKEQALFERRKREELEERISSLMGSLASEGDLRASLQAENVNLKNLNESLKSQLTLAKQENEHLRQQNEIESQRGRDLLRMLEEKKKVIEELRKKYQLGQRDLQSVRQDLESKLLAAERKNRDLDAENSRLLSKIQDLEASLADEKRLTGDLRVEVSGLKRKVLDLEGRIQALEREVKRKDENEKNAISKNKHLRMEIDSLKDKVRGLEGHNRDLENELVQLRARIRELEDQKMSIEIELKRLQNENRNLEDELRELRMTCERLSEENDFCKKQVKNEKLLSFWGPDRSKGVLCTNSCVNHLFWSIFEEKNSKISKIFLVFFFNFLGRRMQGYDQRVDYRA